MSLTFQKETTTTFQPRVSLIQIALGLPNGQIDGKFGSVTEEAVKDFQNSGDLQVTGIVDEETGNALNLPYWTEEIVRELDSPFRDPDRFSPNHEFHFHSKSPGGFFSSRPERFVSGDLSTRRALRTNNPGALNISTWQKNAPGYIGRTRSDSSAQSNKTTIFDSPENGIAAWYHLITVRYEQTYKLISNGTGHSINVKRLAKTYGLGKPDAADSDLSTAERQIVSYYTVGWNRWSERANLGGLGENAEIDPASVEEMTNLGYAMFCHEASIFYPVAEEQVRLGIELAGQSFPSHPEMLTEFSTALAELPPIEEEQRSEEQEIIEARGNAVLEMLEIDAESEFLDAEEAALWKTTLDLAEPESQESTSLGEPSVSFAPPEAETARPRIGSSDVRWVSRFSNHPDYSHLPESAEGRTFDLTGDVVEKAIELNHFSPPAPAHHKLIIVLRGARLGNQGNSATGESRISIREQKPNHGSMRCLIGVYDTESRRLSLFKGSSVPNRGGVAAHYNYRNGHRSKLMCNTLPTGSYELCVGTHYGTSATVRGVLRLGNGPVPANAGPATVLRTFNDGVYGTQDEWDNCKPADNIHPAFGHDSFSSLGCLTVRGRVHTDEWQMFRNAAGFNEDNQGVRYDLVLLSGMEFAAIADAIDSDEELESLRSLRHGSQGAKVRALQESLGFSAAQQDEDFGPGTKFKLSEAQKARFDGAATGIYSRDMDERMGFGLFD